MTLRMRMATIVATSAITGVVLIALAYFAVARMYTGANQLVEQDLSRALARATMRDALERIRRQVPSAALEGHQSGVVHQLDVLEATIDASRHLMREDGEGSHSEARALAKELRDLSTTDADRVGSEAREVESLSESLGGLMPLLRTRTDDLRARIEADPRVSTPTLFRLLTETNALLTAVEFRRSVPEAEGTAVAATLDTGTDRVRATYAEALSEPQAAGTRLQVLQLGDHLTQFVQLVRELQRRGADLRRHARDLDDRRTSVLDRLGQSADLLVGDLNRHVEARRGELAVSRYNLLYELGLAWVVGLALLVALVIIFASGLEHDVAELMDVARAMERGELAPSLRLDRATQELAQVGRAFSRLAGTLAAVREKQTAYNRIVTGLNRNVFLHEILRVSLTELSRATRSKAGCVYLKVTGRDELLLAETYAVPRGANTPELVRMGEGLVGEVARSQETLIVDDVPRGAMKIISATVDADIGCLALVPILYKDELMGVLEMAALQRMDAETVHFVEDVVFQIAVAINNARAIETIRTNQLALQNKTIELEELNAALEHANQLKSEFLATVSHELRTPLNAIIGFSELVLETDRNTTSATRENLQKVLRNGENLLALINDILDLSKIEAGRMTVEATEFDPRVLVREVVADFGPVATRKAVALRCETEAGPPTITQDAEKLRRIVLNLVSNAVKFTEQGEVLVRLFAGGGKVRLEVRDTGIGIEAENLARVFEKFRQADGSVTRRFGGTGLGLAITKELCHLMGGSVRVFSQPGHGSTFTVTLPERFPGPGASPDASASIEQSATPPG